MNEPANTMQLRSITYTSWATLTDEMHEITAIMRAARLYNPMNGITGFLLYNGTRFLQVFEGPQQAVEELLLRVRADRRHAGFELREDYPINQRAFRDWDMQLIRVGPCVNHEALGSIDLANCSEMVRRLAKAML